MAGKNIPPLIAGATIVLPSVLYFNSPQLRAYALELGLRRITTLHILRIAAVPVFFWYQYRGLLPASFVQAAAWGDFASGVLALFVVLRWSRKAGYWSMHIFGMLDFLTAFAIGITLTLVNPLAMHAITGLPMALIPFFAVGLLATTHVIAYHILSKSGTVAAAP